MEVLFETHPAVFWRTGKIDVVQGRARIDPDPVLVGDSTVDGAGVTIYGTVLRDGGCFRMWYQAAPEGWGDENMALVAYAESDDGIEWRKPALDLVEFGDGPNNICDLGVHSPSVFIDPDAPASHRYRATGCVQPEVTGSHPGAERTGYYTLHSQDGLHWELDSTTPAWDCMDVITSVYHPGQQRAIVAMKFNPILREFMRRVIHTSEFKDGKWAEAVPALIPDEYDDICASARGFVSGDYYGTALLPASTGTVAMIWQFRHRLPRSGPQASSMFGVVDISLAYQTERGACWQHQTGRPDFVSADDQPWSKGGIYSASCPIEVAMSTGFMSVAHPLNTRTRSTKRERRTRGCWKKDGRRANTPSVWHGSRAPIRVSLPPRRVALSQAGGPGRAVEFIRELQVRARRPHRCVSVRFGQWQKARRRGPARGRRDRGEGGVGRGGRQPHQLGRTRDRATENEARHRIRLRTPEERLTNCLRAAVRILPAVWNRSGTTL